MEHLISIELAYINTNHPDFVGGAAVVSEWMQREVSLEASRYVLQPLECFYFRQTRDEEIDKGRLVTQL